ncbi:MAG: hypothetical protein AB7P21_03680 [Lautropia sp.]
MRSTMLFLHLIGVVAWVGGMLFSVTCLRPSVGVVPAPERARLMASVLRRFFNLVAIALLLIWTSGPWLWSRIPASAVPLGWYLMLCIAVVMSLVFAWLRLALLGRLDRAIANGPPEAIAAVLAAIHRLVVTNLTLGLLAIAAVKFV